MKHLHGQMFNTGRRIQTFLDANDSLLSSINKSATRTELDTVVGLLGKDVGVQATGRATARGETARQRTLRLALRLNHMRPVAAVAKLKLLDVPNFAALTLPEPKIAVKALLAHATGMAGAAAPYAQVFIDAGLPSDFLDGLTAAIAAVEASIVTRNTARTQVADATGSLDTVEVRARRVYAALNDLVVPTLAADVAHGGLLAAWKSVRRIERKPGPVIGSEQAARLIDPIPVPPAPSPATPIVSAVPTGPITPAVVQPAVAPPVVHQQPAA
jgi:hypothetical protein